MDLNPIRAAIAETIESSDYTSAQRRVQALQEQANTLQKQATTMVLEDFSQAKVPLKDGMLSPLSIDERNDFVGPHASLTKHMCTSLCVKAIISRTALTAVFDHCQAHREPGLAPKRLITGKYLFTCA